MRRRVLLVLLGLVALIGLRGISRALWLFTPGTLPEPIPQSATSPGPGIDILTLNVLCSLCAKTGYDDWSTRLPELRSALFRHNPDLVALQELARGSEITDLLGPDSPYTALTHPMWPDSVVLVRTERFGVLDSGQVWLSPTPTLPLSRAWSPGLPRMVQWAVLRDRKTGGDLLFASTHLDGDTANKDASARLIAGVFPPLSATLPVIVAGDLNTAITDDRFDVLRGELRDAEGLAMEVVRLGTIEGVPHTRRELRPALRIDHILVGPGIAVRRFVHDATTYGEPPRRPSDHPVVFAEVAITP